VVKSTREPCDGTVALYGVKYQASPPHQHAIHTMFTHYTVGGGGGGGGGLTGASHVTL